MNMIDQKDEKNTFQLKLNDRFLIKDSQFTLFFSNIDCQRQTTQIFSRLFADGDDVSNSQ